MTREKALEFIVENLKPEDLVIACNGKLGRELFEIRVRRGEPTNDFILVGAMGCALPVALGVARRTEKRVFCLLGDGNFLMKMGSLATFGAYAPRNLFIYILNNNSHDSTGGQPTSFEFINHLLPSKYNFRIFHVEPGAREDLGRPTISPKEITRKFMEKCLNTS